MARYQTIPIIRFGEYEVHLEAGELRKNGRKLRLPAQAMQVLTMLLEHPGKLATREQLNARLWPNGTIVEFEHGINSSIRRIRAALSDSAEQPRYIETLPNRLLKSSLQRLDQTICLLDEKVWCSWQW